MCIHLLLTIQGVVVQVQSRRGEKISQKERSGHSWLIAAISWVALSEEIVHLCLLLSLSPLFPRPFELSKPLTRKKTVVSHGPMARCLLFSKFGKEERDDTVITVLVNTWRWHISEKPWNPYYCCVVKLKRSQLKLCRRLQCIYFIAPRLSVFCAIT